VPRLDLLIAHNLGFSRGVVTRLCRQGRVSTPEGAPLRDPALQIPPAGLPMAIQLDDAPHTLYLRYHLLQHKPLGVVTALRDDRHATAYDLLKGAPLHKDLRAAGRLDLETSGLLLWTTEGPLLHRMTHPRYAVPRVYQAALRGRGSAAAGLRARRRPRAGDRRDEAAGARGGPPGPRRADRHDHAREHHDHRRQVPRGEEDLRGARERGARAVSRRLWAADPADHLAAGQYLELDLHSVFAGMHPRPRSAGEAPDDDTPDDEADE
jgi:hypothetical protein